MAPIYWCGIDCWIFRLKRYSIKDVIGYASNRRRCPFIILARWNCRGKHHLAPTFIKPLNIKMLHLKIISDNIETVFLVEVTWICIYLKYQLRSLWVAETRACPLLLAFDPCLGLVNEQNHLVLSVKECQLDCHHYYP